MRILYIITLSDLGGAQVHLHELITNLPVGIESFVVSGQKGWLASNLPKGRICIVDELVREIAPLQDVKAVLSIMKIIKEMQPDIIHCHSSKAGFVGRIAARLCGVPAIFTAHGWAFTEGVAAKKRFIYRLLENFAGYLSAKIICVSEYDRQLALQCISKHAEKLVTIYNGVKPLNDSNRRKSNDSVLSLVMVARFSEPKAHEMVLQAIALLRKENVYINISFVGDGSKEKAIKQLAEKLEISSSIQFLGKRTDVHEIMIKHDAFLLISKWEGFPISILEAMREGLPVIASDVGGVSEAIEDGKNGFLIPRDDVEKLAERLNDCILDRNELKKMGVNGKKKFEQNFTTDIMMQKILAIYDEVINCNK